MTPVTIGRCYGNQVDGMENGWPLGTTRVLSHFSNMCFQIIIQYILHYFICLVCKMGMIKHPLLGLHEDYMSMWTPCMCGIRVCFLTIPIIHTRTLELREADPLPEVTQWVSGRIGMQVCMVPLPMFSLVPLEDSCNLVTIKATYFCNIISIIYCSNGSKNSNIALSSLLV